VPALSSRWADAHDNPSVLAHTSWMTEARDQRVGERRARWSFTGVLIVCFALFGCAAVAAGFGIHLARAADHIHHCNDSDLEPCEATWSFPFALTQGVGIAMGLVLVAAASWLAAFRVRHEGFSRVAVAFFVALVGIASAMLIVHSAARGRAIYPYDDPSQWMNVGVVLLAVQATLLLAAAATVIRRSLGLVKRRLPSGLT
jgi:hypothetical protein